MKWSLSQTSWDETKIEKRADWLFDWARVIWNFEDVEFEASNNTSLDESTRFEENTAENATTTMVAEPSDETIAHRTINSNNDRTKYSIDGGVHFLPKNRFVHEAIRRYLELHPETTLPQLKAVFQDSFLKQFKRLGFLCSAADLAKPLVRGKKPSDAEIKRWYRIANESDWLQDANGLKFAVSTQVTIFSAEKVKAIIEAEGVQVLTKA